MNGELIGFIFMLLFFGTCSYGVYELEKNAPDRSIEDYREFCHRGVVYLREGGHPVYSQDGKIQKCVRTGKY